MAEDSFRFAELPTIGKKVMRLGMAAGFGVNESDLSAAAERGVNYWLWNPRFKACTNVLKPLLARDREKHVVASLTGLVYSGGMVRSGVEKVLRALSIDYLDLYQLPWLGRTSWFTDGIQETLQKLKQEGKIKAAGTSIHDRQRAGDLARDSMLDAFMLRYNAKHPGAEQDIFPHLGQRNPAVICYTATSWRQLLKPLDKISMPPWPGEPTSKPVPPLSAELCYRFCLSNPNIHVVLTGPANRKQLEENLAALEAGPLEPEHEAWVREYGRKVKAVKKLPFL